MKEKNDKIDRDALIEAYLRGTLSPEEITEFEARLAEDEALRKETEFFRDLIEGLRRYRSDEERRDQFKGFHEELFGGGSAHV